MIVGLAVAAVIAVVVGAVVLLAGRGSDDGDSAASDSPAATAPSAAASGQGSEGDAETAPVTTDTPTRPTTTTTTVPDDPEAAALAELDDWVDSDASVVRDQLVNNWVPQISAKKIGVEDRGVHYDSYVTILDHFRSLQNEFGDVRLLRSTDYSSFDFDGYFVMVVDEPSFDGATALDWCFSHGLVTNDDCYAKLISNSLGPDDDTNMYPEG